MLLDELLVALGFDYDDKDLKSFKDGVSTTNVVLGRLIKISTAAAVAVTGLTVVTTKAADEEGKFADEIGIAVDRLSALQHALSHTGGPTNGMASSLRNLAIRASEASRGIGSGIEAFGLLGISVINSNGELKNAEQLLFEVSEQFQGLDRFRQIELAEKLGIGQSLRLLRQTPDAIRELIDEAYRLGVTTEEDAILARDFADSLTDLSSSFKQVSRLITRELSPVIRGITDRMTNWWEINKDIIEQQLPEWIEKASKAFRILAFAALFWIGTRITVHIVTLTKLIRALTLRVLALNLAVLGIPALIVGAITAIGLLAQDADVFFKGGESFIGDMIKKFPQLERELDNLAVVFNVLYDNLVKIFNVMTQIKDFGTNPRGFIYDKIKESLSGFTPEGVVNFLGGDISAYGNYNTIPAFTGTPLQSAGNTSRNVNVDNIDIYVNGGQNSPTAIAQEVYNVFQQTSEDLDSPIDQ